MDTHLRGLAGRVACVGASWSWSRIGAAPVWNRAWRGGQKWAMVRVFRTAHYAFRSPRPTRRGLRVSSRLGWHPGQAGDVGPQALRLDHRPSAELARDELPFGD